MVEPRCLRATTFPSWGKCLSNSWMIFSRRDELPPDVASVVNDSRRGSEKLSYTWSISWKFPSYRSNVCERRPPTTIALSSSITNGCFGSDHGYTRLPSMWYSNFPCVATITYPNTGMMIYYKSMSLIWWKQRLEFYFRLFAHIQDILAARFAVAVDGFRSMDDLPHFDLLDGDRRETGKK